MSAAMVLWGAPFTVVTLGAVLLVAGLVRRDELAQWYGTCLLAAGEACGAVLSAVAGYPWTAAFLGAVAALLAYDAWRNRPRRRRRPAKALAKVRDLGHRLTVVPAPAGAR